MERAVHRLRGPTSTPEPASIQNDAERTLHLQTRQRLAVLGLAIVIIAAAMASPSIHRAMRELVDQIAILIETHPVLGVVAFAALSVLSAMMAFLSTAIVVPVAVYAWGRETTLLLLWSSWLLGGCCAYAIGRTLGRHVAAWLVDPARLEYYTRRLPRKAGFLTILLFQLAMPSEIPGYVLGALRYRFLFYFIALALTEIPFAIGAVYLGDGFLHGDYGLLLAIGFAGVLAIGIAFRVFHHQLRKSGTRLADL